MIGKTNYYERAKRMNLFLVGTSTLFVYKYLIMLVFLVNILNMKLMCNVYILLP